MWNFTGQYCTHTFICRKFTFRIPSST